MLVSRFSDEPTELILRDASLIDEEGTRNLSGDILLRPKKGSGWYLNDFSKSLSTD
jgi:predicted nucleic acid-binding Zn ribbon protein